MLQFGGILTGDSVETIFYTILKCTWDFKFKQILAEIPIFSLRKDLKAFFQGQDFKGDPLGLWQSGVKYFELEIRIGIAVC